MDEGFGIRNHIDCNWFPDGVNFEIICEG